MLNRTPNRREIGTIGRLAVRECSGRSRSGLESGRDYSQEAISPVPRSPAGRPKSSLRAVNDRGREVGVHVTPMDVRRIEALGRWYCLSPHHLARIEVGPEAWHPSLLPESQPGPTPEYERVLYAIKRRLARLSRVQENAGNHVGPVVGSALVHEGLTAWYATRYGSTAASLPWSGRSSVNPFLAAHAWMAASVGMQIEALGIPVVSERELSTGLDRTGAALEAPFDSEYVSPNGARTTKKPDIAVLSPDGRSYIAIEVERDRNRPLVTYREKLIAYRDNPAIKGVWYLTSNATTQDRVLRAAKDVLPRGFPFITRVLDDVCGLMEIRNPDRDENLMGHLRQIRTPSNDGSLLA